MTRLTIKFVFLILFVGFAIPGIFAQEYEVRSGYESSEPSFSFTSIPLEEIPVWDLPFDLLIILIAGYTAELFYFVKLWIILGYRRIMNSNVLSHALRYEVFQEIVYNPGIHLQGLARKTNIHMGTLRHHLHMLIITGKITRYKDTSTIRFYENNGVFSDLQKLLLKHLRNNTRNQILDILKKKPSIGRDEIARMLGYTGAAISWHIKQLEADGIVMVHRSGRNVCYLIPDEVTIYLDEFFSK